MDSTQCGVSFIFSLTEWGRVFAAMVDVECFEGSWEAFKKFCWINLHCIVVDFTAVDEKLC